jgi:hypothetical protein
MHAARGFPTLGWTEHSGEVKRVCGMELTGQNHADICQSARLMPHLISQSSIRKRVIWRYDLPLQERMKLSLISPDQRNLG